ncbi:Uncharacterised protein [uncultured archaeon]|nr:Uncharacterised protein [uncultured archaeon]
MSLRFQVTDLNAIETRVGAWLAQCTDLMNVFVPVLELGRKGRNGKDPYLAFATKMYGTTYEALWADYSGINGPERKADAKRKRQVAKPGVLGAIYRLSGGALVKAHTDECIKAKNARDYVKGTPCDCPMVKTGLWAYADNMGVDMSMEQAHQVVEIFRNSYPEICSMKNNPECGEYPGIWKKLELAVADVMNPDRPATVRYIGPGNCVKIDRVNIGHTNNDGVWVESRKPIMRMQLPSGRCLHYLDARLESTMMPWKGEDEDGNEIDIYRDSLIYAGTNQKTKQWDVWVSTHGGKLFENLVQGIARDVLACKLLDFEDAELPIVGHVHDEGIALVEDDILSPTVLDMEKIMTTPIDWAPGLLLGADGYEDSYYHK